MSWDFFKKSKKDYPADQYSNQYKDEVLHSIVMDNDLTKVPIAFSFLLTHSNDLKKRTVEALHLCLSQLTSKEVLALDTLFRNRTSMDWSYDWKNESPKNLYFSDISDDEKVTVLGLGTFHPNGFFREKALKLLGAFETGREVPFLLLRCNDWVFEVRNIAKSLIHNRIKVSYAEQIVKHLPIVFKLKNSNRVDHSVLIEKVVTLLLQQEAVPFLHKGTKSKDNKIRYFSYKIMIYSNMFKRSSLVEYLKLEKEPHSRLLLFNEIMNDINENEFNAYYSILKRDKFPKIRAEVLLKSYTFNPHQSREDLEKALFDKSGTIRSIARFLLKKLGITDFASYYIKVINHPHNENLRGALLGIGEVGDKNHIEAVLPFLESEKAGNVKAAIRAISMLDANNYRSEFIKMLSHDHNGIAKEARKALQKTFYNDKVNEIYRVYKEGKTPHSKYNAAILLASLPKWDSIRFIIEFYVNHNDDSISDYGKLQLVKWIAAFNRTFSAPSKEQEASIRQALMRYGSELDEEDRRHIEFYLKGF
ncbi:HEAT repeat domain-containing protein [Bacillus marinisedimentorum]|uniref:HEAT repeat domain-containing protein n=1 Tax=Bacillus marinisedimentorum TaxID=1821260 RepID=UPI0008731CDB|nr:HEAT repeat domain-containing protein [Bacillus marinisedimentorum]